MHRQFFARHRSWCGGLVLSAAVALVSACSSTAAPPNDHDDSGAGGGGAAQPDPWLQTHDWQAADIVACPSKVADDDVLATLLSALSLDMSVGISSSYYVLFGLGAATDPARLPYFHALQEDLTSVPCTAGNFALRADEARASTHALATRIADASAGLGFTVQVGGAWPPLDSAAPLLTVVEQLHEAAAVSWDRAPAEQMLAAAPLRVREAVAHWVVAAWEAALIRDEALGAMLQGSSTSEVYARSRYTLITGPTPGLNPDFDADRGLLAPDPALAGRLYSGGVRLAQAIDETDFGSLQQESAPAALDVFLPTPLGAIVIRGEQDDVYDPTEDARLDEALLLVLDLGGNDTYRIPAGANTSGAHSVSLNVDLGGDDWYGYVEVPDPKDLPGLLPADDGGRFEGSDDYGPISFSPHARQGAGVLGYGFLIDLGSGSDTYRSLRFSQGFGSLGVGVLSDDGGDDSYTCESGCQAAAVAGIAILNDDAGNDRYRSFQASQSFAGVSAFSLLYDHEGNDEYELVPKEPFMFSWFGGYPNNLSKGQGAATGWRRDGQQLGGGVALLRDGAGDDSYRAAVMAQGNGYWFGFGILADGDGHDQYDLVAYGQGGTQHFALSAFLEGGGAARYNARIKDEIETPRNALGGAHDFSVSFFVEAGGDDVYYAPDIAIGASKCHGLGVFVERGGDDTYHVSENGAIGWATDFDWNVGDCGDATDWPSYGFFVDLAGSDTYDKPDASGYGDGLQWITDDPTDTTALELSGGIDVQQGDTFARAYGATWSASVGSP